LIYKALTIQNYWAGVQIKKKKMPFRQVHGFWQARGDKLAVDNLARAWLGRQFRQHFARIYKGLAAARPTSGLFLGISSFSAGLMVFASISAGALADSDLVSERTT